MNSESVNRWLALAVNLSVVGGIILLALELRQTNDAILAAAYQERANSGMEWEKFVAESEYVAPAILHLQEVGNYDGLSPEENLRLYSMNFAAFHRLDGLHFQYQLGLLDQSYVDTWMKRMFEVWVPRWKATGFLEDFLIHMRPSFRAEVEKYIQGEHVL